MKISNSKNAVVVVTGIVCFAAVLYANFPKQTGKSCLGKDGDTLVESIPQSCKAGDLVATKSPAYFCDFSYPVAFNSYDSAFCVFSGSQNSERVRAE